MTTAGVFVQCGQSIKICSSKDITNDLITNSNDNEISKQIPQRNNGEDSQENSRVGQIATAIRNSYQTNAKELKISSLLYLLNKNGKINNERLNKINRSILSGKRKILSSFFSDKTRGNTGSRRII